MYTEVIIEIIDDDPEIEANDTGIDPRLIKASQAQAMRLLSSQVLNLHHELYEARNEADWQISILKCSLTRMSNNVSFFPLGPQAARGGVWGYLLTLRSLAKSMAS